MASESELVLAAVGDCTVNLDDPDSAFAGTAALLKSADIAFGNSEPPYTSRGTRPPNSGLSLAAAPKNGLSLGRAGFTVMNLATNHILDGGYEGLEDTLELLHGQGIATIGAGLNIEEARRPALITRKGCTVALLGYATVLLAGSEAREDIPGVVPLRVHTMYQPRLPHNWNPGAAPDIITTPHAPDLEAFRQEIARAKEQADFVVVSCHWGDASRHSGIGDYERVLGHYAIDAGADTVLAHHRHAWRAVEIYRGKPIFYCLGVFALYIPNFDQRRPASIRQAFKDQSGEYAVRARPDYPTFPFHPDCRMTGIALVTFKKGSEPKVGVVPCYVQPDGHPEPCAPTSERGRQLLEFLRRATAEVGIETRYEAAGGGALAGFEAIAVHGPNHEV